VPNRRTVLRTYAVAKEQGYVLMPGGLTRVAPDPHDALITNQRGAWTKDTWVLAREPERLTGFWLQGSDAADVVKPAPVMPSRAAENLFWLSRYAERAEGLVRQLRATADRITEFAPGTNPAGTATVHVLLRALTHTTGTYPGFVDDEAPDQLAHPEAEMRALLVDDTRPGTVAHSVRHLLDAAAEVRDQLSNDTWLVIGHLDQDLAEVDHTALPTAVTGALGRCSRPCSPCRACPPSPWCETTAGSSWRRDAASSGPCSCAAWVFHATVTERRDAATDSLVLESALTACESIITYRRRYRSRAQIETALDLLLLDTGNPRSLVFQVDRLLAAAAAIPDDSERDHDRATLDALLADLAPLAHLVDTNALARVDDNGQLTALRHHLERCTHLLSRVAEELDLVHFTRQLPQRAVVSRHPSAGPQGRMVRT
jgi:uncharacterized alpha-E superfamily protein